MIELDRLEEMTDLRQIWGNEAQDFTPWLALEENIALLSEAVGLDITVDDTESAVGDFSADILASETGTERKIIIENQLEDTNHDHLGKLITYAAGKSAEVVIWVVRHAREEHRAAVEWLNNHTDEQISFFLCEIKLYRIGKSLPAVKFEVIERPNDWSKEAKKRGTLNETQRLRHAYWSALNDHAFLDEKAEFARNFKRRAPSTDHWLSFSIGFSACHLSVLQIQKRQELDVELRIDDDKELFKYLLKHREGIEKISGLKLDWRELPERKASRIVTVKKHVSFNDRGRWDEQFDWIMQTMLKMKQAFHPHLQAYKDGEPSEEE